MNLHDALNLMVSKGLIRESINPNNPNEKYYSKISKMRKGLNWDKELGKLLNENLEFAELYTSYPSLRDFIYCANHDMYPEDIPRCPICGDYTKITPKWTLFYRDTCGKMECQNKIKEIKSLEKYGVKNISQAPEVKKKKIETTKEHYGVDHHWQAEEIKQTIKKKVAKNYGENFQRDFFKNWARKNYGVDNISQVSEIRSKRCIPYRVLNYKFRSSIEVYFFLYHKMNGYDVKYEDVNFSYNCNGNEYKYTPDFVVNDKIYELKGKGFLDEDNNLQLENIYKDIDLEKEKAKQKCIEDHNVILLPEDDELLIKCKNFVIDKFGRYFVSSLKKPEENKIDSKYNEVIEWLNKNNYLYDLNLNIQCVDCDIVVFDKNLNILFTIGDLPTKDYKHYNLETLKL